MGIRKIVLVFLVMIFPITSANAQVLTVSGNGKFGRLDGEIRPESADRFRTFLNQNPQLLGIALNSPGGTVVSALKMADEIHNRRLGTFVAQKDSCASACSVLFFAGYDRLAVGALGVHQMDDGGRGDASTLQYVLADLLDAMTRYGVSWEVSKRMLTTPANDMFWIPEHMIQELALNRDLPGDASDVARTVATGSGGTTFGAYPATEYLTGSPLLPDFSGRDSKFKMFRTRIGDGAKAGPNIAGHAALVEIGCGTSCRFAFVVDLRTGEVGNFPYGGEEQYEMQLLYSVDSRLVKVTWANTSLDRCIEQDLLYENLKFTVLSERTVRRVNFCNG